MRVRTSYYPIPAILLCCALSVPGCSRSDGEPGAAVESYVTLFVAASTVDAVEQVVADFEETEQGLPVRISAASSGALAQQLTHGAEADLFLSANEQWVDYLTEQGLVAQRHALLSNRLVVIVPDDSTLGLTRLADLADPSIERIAMADPESAPAGMYAKQALENAGLWEPIEAKVVSGTDVRQTLFHVESGIEAGIVYATDAAASDRVKTVLQIDPALSPNIQYSLILLKPAAENPHARALLDYLRGTEAADVFRRQGFDPLTVSTPPGE